MVDDDKIVHNGLMNARLGDCSGENCSIPGLGRLLPGLGRLLLLIFFLKDLIDNGFDLIVSCSRNIAAAI